jgi:hypothetical protein
MPDYSVTSFAGLTLMPECRCRIDTGDHRQKCRSQTNCFPLHSGFCLYRSRGLLVFIIACHSARRTSMGCCAENRAGGPSYTQPASPLTTNWAVHLLSAQRPRLSFAVYFSTELLSYAAFFWTLMLPSELRSTLVCIQCILLGYAAHDLTYAAPLWASILLSCTEL